MKTTLKIDGRHEVLRHGGIIAARYQLTDDRHSPWTVAVGAEKLADMSAIKRGRWLTSLRNAALAAGAVLLASCQPLEWLCTEPDYLGNEVLRMRADGYTLAEICAEIGAETDTECEEVEAFFNL